MEKDKIKAPTDSEMWEFWRKRAGIDDDDEEDMYDAVRYNIWADGAKWMREQILNPICEHKDKHGSNLVYIGNHEKKCLDCGYVATGINPDGTVYDGDIIYEVKAMDDRLDGFKEWTEVSRLMAYGLVGVDVRERNR